MRMVMCKVRRNHVKELSADQSPMFAGWWFGTFVIFHNIWDNPSH
jgi:hypothetical protein